MLLLTLLLPSSLRVLHLDWYFLEPPLCVPPRGKFSFLEILFFEFSIRYPVTLLRPPRVTSDFWFRGRSSLAEARSSWGSHKGIRLLGLYPRLCNFFCRRRFPLFVQGSIRSPI